MLATGQQPPLGGVAPLGAPRDHVPPAAAAALVLSGDDRARACALLARAVLSFQDAFLAREHSPSGLLCQVWMPEPTGPRGEVVLRARGLPFCVAGQGDLLALFRCVSCRYAFGTDARAPDALGAPGRAFVFGAPELACNIQRWCAAAGRGAYLRVAEARQCHVQSVMILPVYAGGAPAAGGGGSAPAAAALGVLEVVQTSEDMQFAEMAALMGSALARVGLRTCGVAEVVRRAPGAAAVTTLLLPASTGLLGPGQNWSGDDGSGHGRAAALAAMELLPPPPPPPQQQQQQGQLGGVGAPGPSAAAGAADPAAAPGTGGSVPSRGVGSGGGGGGGAAGGGGSDDDSDGGGGGPARARRGAGNPGKPGVRLRLEDLQGQFGVGLKEAAARLGICPTTLKRACRRHGIQRWPRRALQKVSRALDDMEAQAQRAAPAPAAAAAGEPAAPGDARWVALAAFIQQPAAAGAAGGAGPPGAAAPPPAWPPLGAPPPFGAPAPGWGAAPAAPAPPPGGAGGGLLAAAPLLGGLSPPRGFAPGGGGSPPPAPLAGGDLLDDDDAFLDPCVLEMLLADDGAAGVGVGGAPMF